MTLRKQQAEKVVELIKLERSTAVFRLIGAEPLIYNAMSLKTQHNLLFPRGRKTKAERATTLKHIPREEYVDSTYRRRASDEGPTRLLVPARSFKAAIADVAKRVPGAPTTTEVKQMTYVEGVYTDLYGVPQILMSTVRNSDINRTPDIRTRAIVPEWCCTIRVTYSRPLLNVESVTQIVQAAGMLNGVGDFRQQKGAGNFGQFRIVATAEDQKVFDRIMKYGTMSAQDDALKNPVPYDQETEEMLSWFDGEMAKLDSDDDIVDGVVEVGGVDVEDPPIGNGHDDVDVDLSRQSRRSVRVST